MMVLTSDFVTSIYGESWDSSCEKSWVPVQKKKKESKIENVGTLFNQTVYLKTDSKTLYYNYILKLKYSLSIFKYSMG